ncbi:MAG TPA: type II secretion system minor pseudopilin GspK [Allosphingosinicella sp.]|nr:type II secretion system minor pseudopilin GspK [Allosphingosinicella sp.]
MRRRLVKPREQGAALLAVLLLVAVTGAIAAAAMEKLRLSRAVAMNAVAIDQARAYAHGVEQIGILIIEDMTTESPNRTTLAGGWNGGVRRVPLPNGGVAQARLSDGGNCFNINSVASGEANTRLSRRESGVGQFAGLMMVLGTPEGEARRIASAAADWVDSDNVPGSMGAEDSFYASAEQPYRTANTLFADIGELRAVAGMTPPIFDRLRPWLCALPVAELSPINLNTLLPEQAPLLAMLAPGQLSLERARSVLASRPINGWGNQIAFWRIEAMSAVTVPLDVQLQPQLRTVWYSIDARVEMAGSLFSESVLVDARLQPSRIVLRRWSD